MNQPIEKKVIVIAGPLGSGKSRLLRVLEERGYVTLDADATAHRVLQEGIGYERIFARFGPEVLDKEGRVDRLRLYQTARADAQASQDIRSILFPLVKQQLQAAIESAASPVVFVKTHDLDAFEIRDLSDKIWAISPTDAERVNNLVDDHGWTAEAARRYVHLRPKQVHAQIEADLVIEDGGSESAPWGQLDNALLELGSASPGESSDQLAEYAPGLPDEATSAPPATEAAGEAPERFAPQDVFAVLAEAATTGSLSVASQASAVKRIPESSLGKREMHLVLRRITGSIIILLAIAFLTSWGLILAQYGREHLPIEPLQAAWEALVSTGHYITAHPVTYLWAKQQVPWINLVTETLGHSAGLLLLSMTAAAGIGTALGIGAARAGRRMASALIMLLSVAGASTPSFLFAMMLWVANIWVHKTFNIDVLPSSGFGWDAHVIMPVLVLAMRPLAQIAQITYISVREAMGQDYIRTAYSKGLAWRAIQNRHLLPNVLIPILNTLGTSLRFSLASLPIVEVFFHWPGVGVRLLEAINLGTASLVIDLILSLGVFFLFVNMLIEFTFPLIDARLRADAADEVRGESAGFAEFIRQTREIVAAWYREVRDRLQGKNSGLPPLLRTMQEAVGALDAEQPARRGSVLRNIARNPVFVLGSLMLLLLVGLAVFGEKLPNVDPYQVHGVMAIDGEYYAPPFKPSTEFAWGSDHIGRDIRSLVLAGGRRTLSLVFFGMLARMLVGATLGLLAGWQRGSWLDRLVTGAAGIWAAFPATLFAMIVIQALGIQQGMWVFVAAISLVGWGEVAQFVRGQVMTLKPQLFIESARSIGARADQMLVRHILPNLINGLTVLAALEMGGILMLLAELGFLDVFLGGGFRAMIGEAGNMVPIVASYSDVPEWSALIANVRAHWRSYPWMALYPGLAIFLAIMTFNLFGEGLRRFLEDSAIGLGRLMNRYTFLAVGGLAVVLALVLQSAAPLNQYRAEGLRFDERRVHEDIRIISDLQLQGRETGTAGADLAAIYIAQRMAENGIFPGGEHNSYYQRLIQPRVHLLDLPELEILDESGAVVHDFEYREDFVEIAREAQARGEAEGRVIGAAYGPMVASESNVQFDLSNSAAVGHVLIVRAADAPKVASTRVMAVLVIADDGSQLERRDVFPYLLARQEDRRPRLLISPQTAEDLLRTTGSSLADLDAMRSSLTPSAMALTAEGASVRATVEADRTENMLDEAYVNVIGVIPGQGHFMGTEEQVIVVGAYYDGVGTDPQGVVYPGANDNASGVAMMLELARLLKESSYQPDKTVWFVAWAGGERREGLSVVNIANARPGASKLTVETVIELSGVGYGTGNSISIGSDSSYRLVQLFQDAAARYDVPTTTRGRGPHYDLPVGTIFGGRDATTLSLSWGGSDHLAHTPQDTIALIDNAKLQQIGRSSYLTLLVLSRETEY